MSSDGALTSYWASKAYICSTTCAFLVMVFSWDLRVSSCSTYLCGLDKRMDTHTRDKKLLKNPRFSGCARSRPSVDGRDE